MDVDLSMITLKFERVPSGEQELLQKIAGDAISNNGESPPNIFKQNANMLFNASAIISESPAAAVQTDNVVEQTLLVLQQQSDAQAMVAH